MSAKMILGTVLKLNGVKFGIANKSPTTETGSELFVRENVLSNRTLLLDWPPKVLRCRQYAATPWLRTVTRPS
jgi:hypothetical protein